MSDMDIKLNDKCIFNPSINIKGEHNKKKISFGPPTNALQ